MPNLTTVLISELRRLARKEIKSEMAATMKQAAQQHGVSLTLRPVTFGRVIHPVI